MLVFWVKPYCAKVSARTVSLAFGPQHPAAHGILRLNCLLQGETVRYLDCVFGLLHRGTEKLIEQRSYLQSLPYFDRFDYVANLQQEHAFCLAIEGGVSTPSYLSFQVLALRTLFDETSRVLNHLLTLSAVSLDMGAMGPIFWAFEEREVLMSLLEQASGARMHTGLYRPFEVELSGVTSLFFRELAFFLSRVVRSLGGAFCGLVGGRAIRTRLSLVGQLSRHRCVSYGISGLLARSAGLLVDWRLSPSTPYGLYPVIRFSSYLGKRGDNFDRFLLRIRETVESFQVLSQVLSQLAPSLPTVGYLRTFGAQARRVYARGVLTHAGYVTPGLVTTVACITRVCLGSVSNSVWSKLGGTAVAVTRLGVSGVSPITQRYLSMEAVISHFKGVSAGVISAPGITLGCVESPKGVVGVLLVSGGGLKPHRVKLRTPVSHNMNMLASMAVGTLLGDFVMTFCSFDIVLGEIDR